MILKALCDLAEERGLAEDLDYQPKPVRYRVEVHRDGHATILDTAVLEPGEGRAKPRLTVPIRSIPRQSGRTSTDVEEFLVDKCDYVFGCNPSAGLNIAAKLSKRAALFEQRVGALARSLPVGSAASTAASAIHAFLTNTEAREAAFLEKWRECSDEKDRAALTKSLFELVYEPMSPTALHDMSEVRAYWKASRVEQPPRGASWPTCLVSGRAGPPAQKHPIISGVPKTLSFRSSLVSFNAKAFESYGLSRNENAPISRDVAESYVSALNWLLRKGETRQNILISADSVLVFWARGGGDDWVLDGLDSDSPESVRRALETPQSGRPAALDDRSAFYSIVLSGAQGRCVVRTFLLTPVAEAAAAMKRYLDETAIERPYGRGIGNFPLRYLVDSVGLEGRRDTVVSAELATRLYLAALRVLPFPRSVLSAAVRRNRAEAADDEKRKPSKWSRFAARTGLIRALLVRNEGMEVKVTLDTGNRQPAYLLGRLFASLDRIQRDALGKVNASTAERYYGAASSTPAAVLPTLIRRSQHHLAKLGKERPGLATVRDKILAEIMGGLDEFKPTLTLTEQGLFALGFYHQRQAFFSKKEDEQ